MIRLSKKADYGVFVMGQLAARAATTDGPTPVLSAQDLADRANLNRSVVANLLKDFARAGLLESERGVNGGYRLSRAPEDISLKDILAAVEGPFVLVDCASDLVANLGGDTEVCALTCLCHSRSPMRRVHERITRMFETIRLPELCDFSTAPALSTLAPSGPTARPDGDHH